MRDSEKSQGSGFANFAGRWQIALVFLCFFALSTNLCAEEVAFSEEAYAEAPQQSRVEWQDEMPAPPENVCPECDLEQVNRQLPKPGGEWMQVEGELVAPDLPETVPQPATMLPGDFMFMKKHKFTDFESSTSTSNVLEPTTAQYDRKIFYTGNWFAARSINRGSKFQYRDPYTLFTPPTGMSFCCDQEVIYDPTRDMWIWSLLYIQRDGTGAIVGGANRIALSTDLISWWYYDFNVSSTVLPDFPHIRLTDNYLYLTINMFGATGYTGTRISRLPLTAMRLAKGFGYNFLDRTDVFSLTAVKNFSLQDTCYFVSNYILAGPFNVVRVYSWPETSTAISWHDVTLSAWGYSGFSCTAPDGTDPCGRMDDRVLGAVATNWGAPGVSDKVLWLSWNAGPITGRPVVYTYVAKINMNDWTVLGYADIWQSVSAWGYAAMSPNDRGHLGLSLNLMGGSSYVDSYVSIYDDYNSFPPPGWPVWLAYAGSKGPADDKWGDYNCAERYYPNGYQWIGAGHIKRISPAEDEVAPMYFRFGRERDQ